MSPHPEFKTTASATVVCVDCKEAEPSSTALGEYIMAHQRCPVCRAENLAFRLDVALANERTTKALFQGTLLRSERAESRLYESDLTLAAKVKECAALEAKLETCRSALDAISNGIPGPRLAAYDALQSSAVEKPGETFVEKALGGSNQLYRTLVEKRES
jgi:hypothetical protein